VNSRTIIFTWLMVTTLMSTGQTSVSWDKWTFLMGNWVGEGSGQPGQGGGTFSFAFDLDQNILVRKSHTGFPASGGRPAFSHDDLMIVYPETTGVPAKAIYFDNEGHVINYVITYSEKSVVLTSEKKENMPVFRLTYASLDSETVHVKFEMSQDGVTFRMYLEGKSRKEK
jgi:hypothetical protein